MDKDISIGVGFFSFLKVGGNKVIGENLRERERESRRVGYFIFFPSPRLILGCVHLSGYRG
jgi:hypothetical protein